MMMTLTLVLSPPHATCHMKRFEKPVRVLSPAFISPRTVSLLVHRRAPYVNPSLHTWGGNEDDDGNDEQNHSPVRAKMEGRGGGGTVVYLSIYCDKRSELTNPPPSGEQPGTQGDEPTAVVDCSRLRLFGLLLVADLRGPGTPTSRETAPPAWELTARAPNVAAHLINLEKALARWAAAVELAPLLGL